MIEKIIKNLVVGKDLSERKAMEAMNDIMEGRATKDQIAAFLVSLRMKGEKSGEIAGFARSMREQCIRIQPRKTGLVDTCGTGGDRVKTFNISTTSMFVAAGAGIPIAKHGNRSVTSKAGSADVLEALGVSMDAEPESVEKIIEKIGIGFMFAPNFHPAMKYAMPVRKKLEIRTVFNILGPLTNPAQAEHQVLGVYSLDILEKMAYALVKLGVGHSFVIHGSGMDEVTTLGKTRVAEINHGVDIYELTPYDFGLKKADLNDLQTKNTAENAQILYGILKGEAGPKRDIVIANAALAIIAGGKADDPEKAVEVAEESIDSGRAFEKLEMLVREGGDISVLEKFGE
ncbi:MAG: anthranilate phosphoribosyltransferase [Euryarchaeota archaeon]|nr:anthranilate phosphoribosyltransferase [Euryarchaeota archaeon]